MVEFPRSDFFVKRERDGLRFAHGGSALSWHLYNIVSAARVSLFFLSPGMVFKGTKDSKANPTLTWSSQDRI